MTARILVVDDIEAQERERHYQAHQCPQRHHAQNDSPRLCDKAQLVTFRKKRPLFDPAPITYGIHAPIMNQLSPDGQMDDAMFDSQREACIDAARAGGEVLLRHFRNLEPGQVQEKTKNGLTMEILKLNNTGPENRILTKKKIA